MRIIKVISITLVFSLVFYSCKKTKLEGNYSGLAGTWKWFSGWSDNANSNFKLDLKEKGKYKLFNGNEKIDFGRLLEKNGKLIFVSDKLFKKGYFSSGEHQITYHNIDTLVIGNDHIWDFPSSGYIKE
ncbi:MAG TPA: hypothetical protein VN026_07015 [Bacteroidia bacterium]|jgi:hypothetical protein|nr:hypothetical protein [Bacteroidia bacterium]